MTEAMPFLQKYDITFLRPPTIRPVPFFAPCGRPLSLLALTGKGRAADLFRPAPPEGRHRPEKKGNDFSAAQ